MCEFNLMYFNIKIMWLFNVMEKAKLTLNSKKMEV